MKKIGDLLKRARIAKKISLENAAIQLHIKKEKLEALEKSDWDTLPEPTFVKGFIKSYGQLLNLDTDHLLALYRREYDERQFPKEKTYRDSKKRFLLTPNKLANLAFLFIVTLFVLYLVAQYFSILSAPKLEITTPQDDLTTAVPYILVSGQSEKEATVVINGEFIPLDSEGNFSKEVKLKDGQNIIEVIASKRLSPKSKATKIVRLASR